MRKTILMLLFSLALVDPAAAAHGLEVSREDLALLADSDLSDETVRIFLEPRELNFALDAGAIAELRELGVSEEVIRYLLEKMAAPIASSPDTVYVSAGSYPWRYYALHYGHEPFPYFGDSILWHWTHGYHRVGHHLVGRHYGGYSSGHSLSHGGQHAATGGHLVSADHVRSHSAVGGHGGRSHVGSSAGSHSSRGHSRSSHGRSHGGGHSGGGHSGGGHGGGGHGGGGH